MNSISINMKFWHDGQENSTRVRNVNFTWPKVKELCSYLRDKNINCKENLYDFSPEKILDESVHISYPLSVYKKAEKTNIILRRNLNYDFFMMIDCDAFFNYEDFEKIFELLLNSEKGDIYTFDLAKLDNNAFNYIVNGQFDKTKSNWSYAYSGNKSLGPLWSHIGGLGGVYICDTNILNNLGGFDESYEFWGGEDGEMLNRIVISKIPHKIKPIKTFSPFHLPHFTDWENKKYFNR